MPSTIYIETYIPGGPDALMAEVLAAPIFAPGKGADLTIFQAKLAQQLKKTFVQTCAKHVYTDLMDEVCGFEVKTQRYEDIPEEQAHARGDYESAVDDLVEKALEPYDDALSADWLGKHTIDTKLWLDPDIAETRPETWALAERAAKEMYKQITHEKSAAQVFASAGLIDSKVRAAFDARLSIENEEQGTDMTDKPKEYTAVIAKMHDRLGKDFDIMSVFSDVEQAMYDTDATMKASAQDRIGLLDDDCDALFMVALSVEDPVQTVIDDLQAYKPARKRAAKKPKDEPPAGDGMGGVLAALKHCGVGDTAMANDLGVSRSTYTNYIKGKTPFVPDVEQAPLLREALVERANMMLEALAQLDGTEAVAVA